MIVAGEIVPQISWASEPPPMFEAAADARPIGGSALGSLRGNANSAAVNALNALGTKSAVNKAATSHDDIQLRRNSWANQQGTSSTTSPSNNGLKWRAAGGTNPNPTAEVAAAPAPKPIQAATLLLTPPANSIGGEEICTEDCQKEVPGVIAQASYNEPAISPIQPVAGQQEVDPFVDPFGDGSVRVAQHSPRVPTSRLQGPTPAAPRNNNFEGPTPAPAFQGEPTPAQRGGGFQPNPIEPLPTDPLPQNSQEPLPPPIDPSEAIDPPGQDIPSAPMMMPMPMRQDGPLFDNAPNGLRNGNGGFPGYNNGTRAGCERTYNDRNCCEVDRLCNAARLFIHDADIRKISVDITPRFKPDAKTWEEGYLYRDEQLKKTDSRQWFDRGGNLLVQGRLIDLAQNKAVIQSDGGTIQRLSLNVLSEDDLCFINSWWSLPAECVAGGTPFVQRNWAPSTFAFAASGLCHKPLYFEDVQAERYGHSAGPILQPVLSGAHFFLNIAVLPYKMGINPPTECQYSLGYYRPGSCAPWMVPPVPLSLRGALAEAGVIVGGILIIP